MWWHVSLSLLESWWPLPENNLVSSNDDPLPLPQLSHPIFLLCSTLCFSVFSVIFWKSEWHRNQHMLKIAINCISISFFRPCMPLCPLLSFWRISTEGAISRRLCPFPFHFVLYLFIFENRHLVGLKLFLSSFSIFYTAGMLWFDYCLFGSVGTVESSLGIGTHFFSHEVIIALYYIVFIEIFLYWFFMIKNLNRYYLKILTQNY